MRIRSFSRVLTFAALALLASCGGDATGPKTTLSGQWTYSASNISGSGLSCNITGVMLTIAQSASTFSGTTSGGFLSCSGPGGTSGDNLGGDVVANGRIDGSAVQFDIGTQDIHNVGTLSGNSMSGTVTIRLVLSGATYILTGNFTAVR